MNMKKLIIVFLLILLGQSIAFEDECFTDACLCVDCLEGE